MKGGRRGGKSNENTARTLDEIFKIADVQKHFWETPTLAEQIQTRGLSLAELQDAARRLEDDMARNRITGRPHGWKPPTEITEQLSRMRELQRQTREAEEARPLTEIGGRTMREVARDEVDRLVREAESRLSRYVHESENRFAARLQEFRSEYDGRLRMTTARANEAQERVAVLLREVNRLSHEIEELKRRGPRKASAPVTTGRRRYGD